MKKTIALTLLTIFIVSLIPLAFAEEGEGRSGDVSVNAEVDAETGTQQGRLGVVVREEAKLRTRELREEQKERLRILKEENRAKIETLRGDKVSRLTNLSNERLQRIAELDQRQIDRLAALEVRNLEKIAELKKERLERLTKLNEEKLERIAGLEKEELERISDLNETELEKFSTLNRARLKELAKLEHARLKAELKAFKVVKVKNLRDLNDKNITNEELALLRQRFENARANLTAAREELDDARRELRNAINEGREEAAFEHSKNYLLRSISIAISHLEKIKVKIQENEHISDEEEASLVAEVDVQISDLNGLKAEAEAATTKDQIKELARKFREKWRKLREISFLLHAERVMNARVEGLVKRTQVLEKRLDKILEGANESVKAEVSAEIELFSQKITLAEDKYKQAQAKWSEAFNLSLENKTENRDQIRALVNEAKELRKEAHEALKDAHDVLKTIVRKIKQSMPDAELSADVEVEVAV